MDQPQGRIAVLDPGHQNAHGTNVIDLRKADALALHLPPDAVDMLDPTGQLGVNPRLFHGFLQSGAHGFDVVLAVQPALVQQPGNLLVGLGLQVAKREVFQLPLDVADAQPVGQGCVEVEHLPGHAVALAGLSLTPRIAQVRSASLMRATRTSSTMATSILRTVSLWSSWRPSTGSREPKRTRLMAAIRSTPSIRRAMSPPNCCLTSSMASLSSRTARYSTAAINASSSRCRSVRISTISRPVARLETLSDQRLSTSAARCSACWASWQATSRASALTCSGRLSRSSQRVRSMLPSG